MNDQWRKQLMARLAAERNFLLRQFWGLDETTLTTVPVTGDWTAKDILAHIAFWDGFANERMSRAIDGRLHELHAVGGQAAIDAHNRERSQQFQEMPLETAVATLLKERRSFHALLKRISDHDLHRQLRLADGHRTRLRVWARSRWRHDANHAQALASWRKKLLPNSQEPQIGPKYILRALLQSTRKEFLRTADLIPDTQRTILPVCGVWTLKDVIGHLTDWEKVGLDGLKQLAAGRTPEFDYAIPIPFDEFNRKNAAARQTQSWTEVWHDFTTTRQDFMTTFDNMPETQLECQFMPPWQHPINGYRWLTVWLSHNHEHALDLVAASATNGWPQRLQH